MKPKLLIRIAAGCMLFFAVGHSIGHSTRHDATDAKSLEVWKIVREHKFDVFGEMRSIDENYTGMSLNFIFTLLAFTVVLWVISNRAERDPAGSKWTILPIMLAAFGYAVTSYLYFFMVPAATSLIAGISLAIAFVKLKEPGY
jgi:hypothetical protein